MDSSIQVSKILFINYFLILLLNVIRKLIIKNVFIIVRISKKTEGLFYKT